MTLVSDGPLRDFVTACYLRLGVRDATAQLLSDTLVQADLWGHSSHGVMRTFWYGARLESGAMDGMAVPEPEGTGALQTMDAQRGVGQLSASVAMEAAISAAKAHGIGAVSVRNSGHFGTAMYFTRMAARAGCIGFLSTNASPAMAAWGGAVKQVGNNPWSWAAPAGRHPPMMLDLANTAVARGKLYLAKSRGEAIPEGWAIDAHGRATTDAAAGIAGTILPMAGHKGYGISLMMDVISGVLSSGTFGTAIRGPYEPEGTSGVGHLAIAIDIAACRPLADFEADMEKLIDGLKTSPCAPGVEEIFYPGEREARTEVAAKAAGIDLPPAVIEDLASNGNLLGVEPPF